MTLFKLLDEAVSKGIYVIGFLSHLSIFIPYPAYENLRYLSLPSKRVPTDEGMNK